MSMLFREHRFGSHHPHQEAHNCLSLQLQGIWHSILASSETCTHAYFPTDTPFIECINEEIFKKHVDDFE